MADSFLLTSFSSAQFVYPTGVFFELVFLIYSFLFHFIYSVVNVVAAQMRWLIVAGFKL